MSWPCQPCCRGRNCELCGFDARPAQWAVDLGTPFGLVDDRCDFCDQITGQYTLGRGVTDPNKLSVCQWGFASTDVCDVPFISDLDLLVLFHHDFSAPSWNWRVDITLTDQLNNVHMRLGYETTGTTENDCWHFGGQGSTDKVTLTKTDENIQSTLCTSTGLATTIEAWTP